MPDNQPICTSDKLESSGLAVRFQVKDRQRLRGVFVIRFQGSVYAYFNECAHREMELDWNPGDVFDADGEHLICATHGAIYNPIDGACRGGPCNCAGLLPLNIIERDGQVFLNDSNYQLVQESNPVIADGAG